LGNLATLIDHANANPEVYLDDVKDFLSERVSARPVSDVQKEPRALNFCDIDAARKRFVNPEYQPERMHSSRTKGVTKQAQETDEDKEEDDEEAESVIYAGSNGNNLETQLEISARNSVDPVQYNGDPDNVPDTIQ
jgi:hypothetical protein